jgi:hypothetical protein
MLEAIGYPDTPEHRRLLEAAAADLAASLGIDLDTES